jgi:hypothetical protein
MKQLLDAIGIESDLSGYPGRIKFKHWLPFKEQLLAWDESLPAYAVGDAAAVA